MKATRRDFLRAGMVTGLAAAAGALPAVKVLAQAPAAPKYQHPEDPAHLSALELAHWPKLDVVGSPATGKPFQLAIQVGQLVHPMTAKHHIEWIEVWAGDARVERMEFAQPMWAQPVISVTLVRSAPTELKVRINCNLHGPWENSIKV